MGFDFTLFNREEVAGRRRLDEDFVAYLVNEQSLEVVVHYEKLWSYYRNELCGMGLADVGNGQVSETARLYRQQQEYGLPSRITGVNYSFYEGILSGSRADGIQRKEVVIENDIAWRIDTMVDFLFGKGITIVSRASQEKRAQEIQRILNAVLDANGGATYLQQLALLGSTYGFVDVILRWSDGKEREKFEGGTAGAGPRSFDEVLNRARKIMLEALEAPRCLPILEENNYHRMKFYIQHYWQRHNELERKGDFIQTVNHRGKQVSRQKESHNVEVIGADYWQRYQDEELVAVGRNLLGVIPVVHIQNMPLPSHYEGQSDVAPLIPLQDELNTRLSDRASRITFQSFKMYLGKGIEGFENRVVAPGRMWSTENPEACIEEFGGDPGSPSEEVHIEHVREALDKASGVASVAAGILKGRIGNLTSAVALKVTLMGVLAKTERKRRCYGQGIKELCRLILLALDRMGVYPNSDEEREVDIHWPSPLPENVMEKLQEQVLKKELGIPQEQILKELGY